MTTQTRSVEVLNTFRTAPDAFDLVITDMTMPNLTGDNLAAEVRKIRPDMPIIICTGFSEVLSKEKIASLEINGYLMKPLTLKDLGVAIRKALDD